MVIPYCLVAAGGASPGVYKIHYDGTHLHQERLIASSPGESIYRVALAPSLSAIAAASKYGDIYIYQLDPALQLQGTLLYRTPSAPSVYGLAFLSDEIMIASGSDYQIRVYDLSNPKGGARIGELKLPGIAFSVTAFTDNLFGAILREQGADHFVVWDIRSMQRVFTGPAFKIAEDYLLAAIDFDAEQGIIVHGDRNGNVHLYDSNNNFAHRLLQAGHGNFYGTACNDGYLFTAGNSDKGNICRWSLAAENLFEKVNPANVPVLSLNRLDKDHLIALLANDQLLLLEQTPILRVKERMIMSNARQVISLPAHRVMSVNTEERKRFVLEQLTKIQQLFETGQMELAYRAVQELEKNGYRAEALQALALAEKAQGLILSELEALLSLFSEHELSDELLPSLARLAEILEIIHEPELAISTLIQLNSISNDPSLPGKIELLKERCIPAFDGIVLLAGFPEKEAVLPEIRKAEILGRNFSEAVSFEEEVTTSAVSAEWSLDLLSEKIPGKIPAFDISVVIESVFVKRGKSIYGPLNVLRIISDDEELRAVELWVEVRPSFNELRLVIYRVFYAGPVPEAENWNLLVLQLFERQSSLPLAGEWFSKMTDNIMRIVATSANPVPQDGNDDPGEMFKSRKSK